MKIQKEKLKEILSHGPVSATEIAKLFNCTTPAVYHAIKKCKIYEGRKPSVKSRQYPSTRVVKLIADILKNLSTSSIADIAKNNNCTREYVSQLAGQLRTEGLLK
jgi:biotin operon repressor